MKKPSYPTEALSVNKQKDVDLEVQLDSVFCPDADSTATMSPEAYLLECAEVSLQLRRGEGRCFVDELL